MNKSIKKLYVVKDVDDDTVYFDCKRLDELEKWLGGHTSQYIVHNNKIYAIKPVDSDNNCIVTVDVKFYC